MKIYKPPDYKGLMKLLDDTDLSYDSAYFRVFRGQICDWRITPGISRNEKHCVEYILENENKLFNVFQNCKIFSAHLQKHPDVNYTYSQIWFNLFQAQHLELKTRLTDWTRNTETALFFSVYDKKQKCIQNDGVIWILNCPKNKVINFNLKKDEIWFNKHPFLLDDFYLVNHYTLLNDNYFNSTGEIRRNRQNGFFLISPSKKIKTPIDKECSINDYLIKIIISPSLKEEIKTKLNDELESHLFAEKGNKCDIILKLISDRLNNKYFKS